VHIFCISHHAPELAIQRVSEEGVDRPLEYENHPAVDDVDKLAVEYAIAVTNTSGTGPAMRS
jgi:hypothetical protein